VRAGDDVLLRLDNAPGVEAYAQFFQCAEKVQQQLVQGLPKGQRVLWYLISDSMPVGGLLPR
jgi:hypothetical protein